MKYHNGFDKNGKRITGKISHGTRRVEFGEVWLYKIRDTGEIRMNGCSYEETVYRDGAARSPYCNGCKSTMGCKGKNLQMTTEEWASIKDGTHPGFKWGCSRFMYPDDDAMCAEICTDFGECDVLARVNELKRAKRW